MGETLGTKNLGKPNDTRFQPENLISFRPPIPGIERGKRRCGRYVSNMLTYGWVNVISRDGLKQLATRHPEARDAALIWYKAAKKAKWRGLHEVRQDYPSAGQVGDVLIFNILGNRYRLIARVAYDAQRIYVKALLTHREYDRKEWMKWA